MHDYDDAIERMLHDLDEDDGNAPPLWNPEKGTRLVGKLLRYDDRMTKDGPCRVAVVRNTETEADDTDLWSVFLSRSVLKNEFERQSPQPGDHVGIKYFGQKEPRNGGRPYHHYTLRVVRSSGIEPTTIITTTPAATPPPSTNSNDDDAALPDLPF